MDEQPHYDVTGVTVWRRSHPKVLRCVSLQMVMYTHQFGPRSGGLSVLLANDKISPVWERGGALGDVWVKAEVELVSSSVFQVSAAPPGFLMS